MPMPIPLQQSMSILVLRVKALSTPGSDHGKICRDIASEFYLWEVVDQELGECRFPTWLSRVVEGVMRDVENNEFSV